MLGRFGAEHLRSSAQNRRSLPSKLGYSQVTEKDERALSSASTPVHHVLNGAGKSPFSVASRQSMGQMTSSNQEDGDNGALNKFGEGKTASPKTMSQLPRRYGSQVGTPGKSPQHLSAQCSLGNSKSPSSYAGGALSPALGQRGQTPKGGMGNLLGARVQTPNRDENETPNGEHFPFASLAPSRSRGPTELVTRGM